MAASDDRIRLGEMVAAAVKAKEAEDAAEVERLLQPSAAAVSVGPESTGWLLNVSFLVARGTAEDFLAAAEQVRKSHAHLELRVNGPLPPYSFIKTRPGRARGRHGRRRRRGVVAAGARTEGGGDPWD